MAFLHQLPTAVQLFFICFLQSCVVAINYRAVAQARYLWTFVSDWTLFLIGYFVVKKIVEASSLGDGLAYAFGGACGSMLAIYITKKIFGK